MDGGREFTVTAIVNNDEFHCLAGRPDMTIKELTECCKAISPSLGQHRQSVIVVFFNGRILSDVNKTLNECGVSSGDALAVNAVPAGTAQLENVARMLRENRQLMDQLKVNENELWQAVVSNDTEKLKALTPLLLDCLLSARLAADGGRSVVASAVGAPGIRVPTDEERQLLNIDAMLAHALEHMPEMFGQVSMLFIHCKVNNFDTVAFIDSGAQATIMSQDFATRSNLMQLVDKRFHGVAMGVGSCRIIGRLHVAQIQIGNSFLPVSCLIVENQPMDILFGLDMLKRHQCLIDLKNNCLVVGESSTPFLAEHQIPDRLKNIRQHMAMAAAAEGNGQGTSSSSSAVPKSRFSEADLTKVCSAGFTRTQAIEALERSNGNVKKAIALLVVKYLDKA